MPQTHCGTQVCMYRMTVFRLVIDVWCGRLRFDSGAALDLSLRPGRVERVALPLAPYGYTLSTGELIHPSRRRTSYTDVGCAKIGGHAVTRAGQWLPLSLQANQRAVRRLYRMARDTWDGHHRDGVPSFTRTNASQPLTRTGKHSHATISVIMHRLCSAVASQMPTVSAVQAFNMQPATSIPRQRLGHERPTSYHCLAAVCNLGRARSTFCSHKKESATD